VTTTPSVALDWNWPLVGEGDPEFAHIGDEVADELSRESRESSEAETHFAWVVWTAEPEGIPLFSLAGCADPGGLWAHYDKVSDRIGREFAWLYADAGFYEQPPAVDLFLADALGPPDLPTLVPRRCVGDPSMDPTVLVEGAVVPWLQPAQLWTDLPEQEDR
jgi:hypothetical protein